MRALIRTVLFAAVLIGLSAQGFASSRINYRALLVGVSNYPLLDRPERRFSLEGPKNDVTRMRALLLARGVPSGNITVLADGVAGAALPTRQQIFDALDYLAKTASPDDYIVIHMGGHGSQVPVIAGSSQAAYDLNGDGLFQIFLPRDVSGWENKGGGADGEVKNAILDYELRSAVDRITATGAFAWVIVDSCHSATMVRSVGSSGVRLRQVSPTDLGIPTEVIDRSIAKANVANARKPSSTNNVPRSLMENPGQAVYFYAAQTHEPAPEMPLPAGAPGRVSHGLFSHTIMQALEGGANMTYQQLAQQVLTSYAGNGDARATPAFSGTALQSGVLGQPASLVRQWIMSPGPELSIPAGELSEIRTGAIVAILPTALSRVDESLGFARVISATATRAQLTPESYEGKPSLTVAALREGKVARLVRPALDFMLTVSTDLSACAKPCPFAEPLNQMRNGTGSNGGVPGVQVKWTKVGEPAQLVLKAQGRKLWLVPASLAETELPKHPEKTLSNLEAHSAASPNGIQTRLAGMLQHASKATNIMRVASSLSSDQTMAALQLQLNHVNSKGEINSISGSNVPTIRPGDRIAVTMMNTGRKAMDVTALYLDSKFGVIPQFPGEGATGRLEPNAQVTFSVEIDDSTLGLERLAFIAVEAKRHAAPANYSFLGQDTLNSEVVRRGGPDYQLFMDAGFADHVTRGAPRPADPPVATGMQVFAWRVLP